MYSNINERDLRTPFYTYHYIIYYCYIKLSNTVLVHEGGEDCEGTTSLSNNCYSYCGAHS